MISHFKQRFYPIISFTLLSRAQSFSSFASQNTLKFEKISVGIPYSSKKPKPIVSIYDHIMKNPFLILEENTLDIFKKTHHDIIGNAENAYYSMLEDNTIEKAGSDCNILFLLSNNEKLQTFFAQKFSQQINLIPFFSLIKTTWYACLSNHKESQQMIFESFFNHYQAEFLEGIPSQSNLIYKSMMTQLLYNIKNSSISCASKAKELYEGSDLFIVSDFDLNFCIPMADALQEQGVNVLSISKIEEIYNIEIELENKIVIVFYHQEFSLEKFAYQAIKSRNLKSLGYKVIYMHANPRKCNFKRVAIAIKNKIANDSL